MFPRKIGRSDVELAYFLVWLSLGAIVGVIVMGAFKTGARGDDGE